MQSSRKYTLSIIVLPGYDGLLIHKTMRSIELATKELYANHRIKYEIIVSVSASDNTSADYLKNYDALSIKVIPANDESISATRDSAIKTSSGKYVTFIKAGDLITGDWLVKSVENLEKLPYGTSVVRPSHTVFFTKNKIKIQTSTSLDRDQSIFLSLSRTYSYVYLAPRTLFEKKGFFSESTPNEDIEKKTELNFIEEGATSTVIPETIAFIRHDLIDETANNQYKSPLKHSLYTPSTFRQIDMSNIKLPRNVISLSKKELIKMRISRYPFLYKFIRIGFFASKAVRDRVIKRRTELKINEPEIDSWLIDDIKKYHELEKDIFPHESSLIENSINDSSFELSNAYMKLCEQIGKDCYDYILFVPYIKRGGADLFIINYANTAANLGRKVLVIATFPLPFGSSDWSNRLNNSVDFIEFGAITKMLPEENRMILFSQLLANLKVPILHVINSDLAYDFMKKHQNFLKQTKKTIIATAYSETIEENGKISGFSHSSLPDIYNLVSKITTDNERIKKMWVKEYSFDKNSIYVHHQPIIGRNGVNPYLSTRECHSEKPIYLLWASRWAPEKVPPMVYEIIKYLPSHIHIDMYGELHSKAYADSTLRKRHPRVHYAGPYNGFNSIDTNRYSLYLYTSLFDGMPNAPLEAALADIPIIASNVGDLKQFIGENGVVVDDIKNPKAYAEQIVKMIENKSLYEEKAKKLQKKAENLFSQANFDKEVDEMLRTP